MNTLARAALAAGLSLAAPALAGDVNPPPGPIQPTGVTLAEIRDLLDSIETQALEAYDALVAVDPGTPIESLPSDTGVDFVISEPGSYFLAGDWFGDGANTAIEIRSSDVEIDLRGFSIVGGGFFDGTSAYGIDTLGGVHNVSVRNGSIVTFGDSSGGAVRLNGDDCVVEDVRVILSEGSGINVGASARVTRCVVFGGLTGVSVGDGSVVKDCAVKSTAGNAFRLDGGSSIENCTADSCGGAGYDASQGTVLSGCVATRNAGNGFDLFGSVVRECVAFRNTGDGFSALNSQISFSTAGDNTQVGFDLAAGNHVTHCSANRNDVGGFRLNGVRNHVSSNHSVEHTGGAFGFQVTASATDSFLFANFGEQNSSYYDFQTTDAALGTRKVNFSGASRWDNYSN